MKRVLCLTLCLVFVLAGLFGCAAETETQPTPTAAGGNEPVDHPEEDEAPAGASTATATAQGFGGEVSVTVTVEGGVITEVTAVGDNETAGIGSTAIERLPGLMVEQNTVEVEGISGATFTSNALLSAAQEAYDQAAGISAESAEAVMAPGTYRGEAAGFYTAYPVQLDVEVSESEILSITVVDSVETIGVGEAALEQLPPEIIATQSTAIDAIGGATVTSNAIKAAVNEALAQALEAGGSPASAISAFQTVPEKSTATETIETGVLVVGLGGSGTMAALRAAETMYAESPEAVDVLAIDKAGFYGGTSVLTADMMVINPERLQEERNNGEDYVDADAIRTAWLEYCQGDAKEEIVDLMIDYYGDMLDYLVYEHGLDVSEPLTGFTERDIYRCKFQYMPNTGTAATRRISNRAFYDGLMEDYTALGGEYMLRTNAHDLIYDEATNTVQGVIAEGADGTTYEIYADAVILATGGFAGNPEMETEYLSNEYYPLKGAWRQTGMTQNTGEMIEAAIGIGAGTYNIGMSPIVHMAGTPSFLTQFEFHVNEDAIGGFTNRPQVWTEGDLPVYMGVAPNSLAVGADGRRFSDETGVAMLDSWKAGPRYYSIYSAGMLDEIRENGLKYTNTTALCNNMGTRGYIPTGIPMENIYEVFAAGEEAGIVVSGETAAELAEKLGMDPSVLEETLANYNSYCETGVDLEFGKAAEYLEPLGEGPYYAIVMAPYCYSTCGALDVDVNLNVLKADGVTPINGLYAVGTDSLGCLNTEKDAYVTYGGQAQGWAYTSGYLAGKTAAGVALAAE